MATVKKCEVYWVDLEPKVVRSDAIQSFVCQETIFVEITDSDGATGMGYSYTIGTGGSSIVALLKDHLLPKLIGMDCDSVDSIWQQLVLHTHATHVGAITSLAMAAIDTALWDLRSRRAGVPLYKLLGGNKSRAPVYTTEGGWLHLSTDELVDDAVRSKELGFMGCKIKVGKPSIAEDMARLGAVRLAVGDDFEIMTDANQSLSLSEALRRADRFAELGIAWLEEPLMADDVSAHVRLSARARVPIAIGESIYSARHFSEYVQRGACSIVQVDVARIGGITPWLKVAHMAELNSCLVCPHFLMEIHTALVCAVKNSRWVEYIPQLDELTHGGALIADGHAHASEAPGLGIDWDMEKIAELSKLASA